jgi:F0F1-type ATP synthase gamma subunit
VKVTFDKFLDDYKDGDMEATIIGKVGQNLFTSYMPGAPFTYFDSIDFGSNPANFAEVIKHLVQYEEITVYYGKYQSVVKQIPSKTVVSSGTVISEEDTENSVSYIFEPGLEEILMFFETEVFTSSFDHSIRESQLAKYSSRIFAMDKASQTISRALKKTKEDELRVTHRHNNRQIINSLASTMAIL